MKQRRPLHTPLLLQHLIYGAWALVVVLILGLYQRAVLADPLTVAHNHWKAIAAKKTDQVLQQYDSDATLLWTHGSSVGVHQGEEIHQAWQSFFKQYQIQSYRILQQQKELRSVQAEIRVSARSKKSSQRTLKVLHEVRVDDQGKIIHEVWKTNPDFSD